MPRKKLTKDEFLKGATKIHGHDFSYDKVNLDERDSNGRVCIICNECGNEFWQTPSNHLSGQRCPHCRYKRLGQMKQNTQEWFISKSKSIFGDEFWDYSQCVFKGYKNKVFLICHEIDIKTGKEYGGFWVTPNSHLKGSLPREMALLKGKIRRNSLLQKEVIDRFKEKHGDKYDYSRVVYEKMCKPVVIGLHEIDPLTGTEYGWFEQTPIHHLESCTHPKKRGRGYSQEDMLNMFYRAHGDEYDYSESVYNGMQTKVKIICHKTDIFGKEHGAFYQTPNKHVRYKQGCPLCAGKKKDTDYFVEELKQLYGEELLYDNTIYINAKTPVRVDCPKHGPQFKLPSVWLKGGGCSVCHCSVMEHELIKGLSSHGINYVRNFMPLWLKSKNNHQQSVDFYLVDYNIAIECQGVQHFRPVNGFITEEQHKLILERDENKREVLKENNVRLIYYTNEHTIPNSFKKYFIYFDKEKLFNDIKENKIKDIYGATVTEKYNKNA